MSRTVLLLELEAYDVAGAAVVPLYLSDVAYATEPTDTPASVTFFPLLVDPLSIRRRVQGIRGGVITPSLGEIRALNTDGRLDDWAGYAFDGRPIVAKLGPVDGAYATDFDVVFTGTMDRVDVTEGEVVIRLRDAIAQYDTPLLTTLFAGDNVPPDGLEGGADLEGAPKPRVYGQVRNIPLTAVNAQKLIYHVSDNAVDDVPSVYDSGVLLGKYTPVDFAQVDPTTTYNPFRAAASDTAIVALTQATPAGIYRTTDGTTWAAQVTAFTAACTAYGGVAYSPTLARFCAVIDGGEIATSDDDGVTWTLRTPAAASAFRRVRWCARRGLFVAVGGAGVLDTSPDGITWTAQTSGTASALNDVAVDGAQLVAVGAGGAITTSPDGVTWTATTLGTAEIFAAIFATDTYVITGAGNATIWRSSDASAWTLTPIADQSIVRQPRAFAAAGGYLLAWLGAALVGNVFSFSLDRGRTWTAVAYGPSGPTALATELVPFADRWYAVTLNGIDRSGAPSQYASLADLEDDTLAPLAGSYKWIADATGSYVRLGSVPAGRITADVTQGATAADRTCAALLEAVLTDAGYSASDWVAADFTALDTADGSAVHGLYVTGDTTVSDCLEALAGSVGAFWTLDNLGRFRVQQLAAPSGSPTFTITDDTCLTLSRLTAADPLAGIPSYRTTLRYNRNYSVQRDGLAGGVSAARRAELAREWQEVVETDASVQTAHLLAQAIVDDSTYADSAAAQSEATRRQALRGVMRHAYQVTVSLDDYASVDLGDVGTLSVSRFGLSGGQLVRVLGVEPRGRERTVTLVLWF